MKIGPIKTSQKEIKDLLKAWFILSLAFAILLAGFQYSFEFLKAFFMASITVGLGFILHELSHKFVAQRYGCFAEFRSFDFMLFLALFMSFFGFILAAPGGVYIQGEVGRVRNGKISSAGIIANLIIAFIFLGIFFLSPFKTLGFYGFFINSWLALFNLIPIANFDGIKVLRWDKKVYGSLVVISVVFMLIQPFMRPL